MILRAQWYIKATQICTGLQVRVPVTEFRTESNQPEAHSLVITRLEPKAQSQSLLEVMLNITSQGVAMLNAGLAQRTCNSQGG